jgi:hypothetical protein
MRNCSVNVFFAMQPEEFSRRCVNTQNERTLCGIVFPQAKARGLRLLPVAEFPQMNFTQMQERIRLELQRRIQRGTLSLSLLSRQTGFRPSHLSNFVHSKRQLSLEGMDRVLAALHMGMDDLLPAQDHRPWRGGEDMGSVPLVSHATAMYEPIVRSSSVHRMLHLPEELLREARTRSGPARKKWMRFVAIRIGVEDAAAMHPVVSPDALVLLDRHYNSLTQYRAGRPNLYAVRHELRLVVRYAEFQASRLVLRPHNRDAPVELVEMAGEESPGDFLAGRVVLVMNIA